MPQNSPPYYMFKVSTQWNPNPPYLSIKIHDAQCDNLGLPIFSHQICASHIFLMIHFAALFQHSTVPVAAAAVSATAAASGGSVSCRLMLVMAPHAYPYTVL